MQRPHRVGSKRLPEPPHFPRAWTELCACFLPLKDKKRCGLALQERNLTAQMWEDMHEEVASFSRKRGWPAGLAHRVLPGRGSLMTWDRMCLGPPSCNGPNSPLVTSLWEHQIECAPLPPGTDKEIEAQEEKGRNS